MSVQRAHTAKVVLAIILSTGTLIATSSSSVRLEEDQMVPVAPGETVEATLTLSRRAVRRADRSFINVSVAGTTEPTMFDAGPDAPAIEVVITLNDLPVRLPLTGGFVYESFHSGCAREACTLPLTVRNSGSQNALVRLRPTLEDDGSTGIVCGEAGHFPEDATMELTIP